MAYKSDGKVTAIMYFVVEVSMDSCKCIYLYTPMHGDTPIVSTPQAVLYGQSISWKGDQMFDQTIMQCNASPSPTPFEFLPSLFRGNPKP